MGTMLQAAGLRLGENPEVLNITAPEVVHKVHAAYFAAGSEIVYTNTFGANAHKLARTGYTPEQVITAAVEIAKAAAKPWGGLVALDIGPIGELLEPMGSLKFEEAYELFVQQIRTGAEAGADLIAIETMTDLYEAKAALLAARENCDLPVFVTMTFEQDGRTFTGCSIPAMALTLQGLGAAAIGINCSLGPKQIYSLAEMLIAWTTLPVIIKPNAGLPTVRDGKTSYDLTPAEFGAEMARFLELGVSVMGGCCGTNPDFIRELCRNLEGKVPDLSKRTKKVPAAVCSNTEVVPIDQVRVIGERINPTGKKLFKQALLNGDMDYIVKQGIEQAEAGADILDVNVGLPSIDEAAMMARVVKELQGAVSLPLQIDSSDQAAAEAGLRCCNGKPILNSVNGEEAVLSRLLPLVKKYGCAVIGLTLDEKGIPKRAEDRLKIAARIKERALEYGIPAEDVYIDCLTLTASAEQESALETVRAVRMVKDRLGLKTVLGVSNISFGLPAREKLNQTFLTAAMAAGLDLPIINPNAGAMMDAVAAFLVLSNADKGSVRYISRFAQEGKSAKAASIASPAPTGGHDINFTILHGMKDETRQLCRGLLKDAAPLDIVNGTLIPALDEVGKLYESGKIFLPQLIAAAEAAKSAFEEIRSSMPAGDKSAEKGPIVLATVKGDIHDIGKNIVKVVLENYGYRIIDLGKDVPVEEVVQAVKQHHARLVGLSALMTTTLVSMEQTIKALRESGCGCRIWVGGAVLTPEYAREIGADFYAKDAQQSVAIAKEILG
ncbi:MAG: dihydropteroate synthase [Oscillospiraceae bacterium]|nr:dihydropteroate synthase [Oscillospiraceae bacterium]